MANGQFQVELTGMHFRGYHGLFPAERKTGNTFEVDISITCRETAEDIHTLAATIDYSAVFNLIKQRMQEPQDLLETLCQQICTAVYNQWAIAEKIELCIRKLQAPIEGFSGKAGVRFRSVRPAN